MPSLRYSFRPNLLRPERVVLIDDAGLRVRDGDGEERSLPWTAVEEVHIEPATAGEDGRSRWLINLAAKDGGTVQIDSVNVRGTQDYEHKSREFREVLAAIHAALEPRAKEVRFVIGMRRGIKLAWRIGLGLMIGAGAVGTAAAIYTGNFNAVVGALGMVAAASGGLAALRGRNSPRPYDPAEFELDSDDEEAEAPAA